ncbi:MAG: hypothetical protein WC718_03005 [Phycisphaerales bacterium]|jgi:ABC-type Fe3+ transport system permease subunit
MATANTRTSSPAARVAAGILLGFTGLVLVVPAVMVVWNLVGRAQELSNLAAWTPAWALLGWSFIWAFGIGVLATVLAWPTGWATRGRGWGATLVLLPVIAFPSYLSYAGYGLLRAPRTGVGDLIERMASGGWQDLPMVVGRGVALFSMALWCWPIATIVLAAGLKKIPESVLDSLALEPLPWWRKSLVRLGMSCGPLTAAVGVCAVLMLGSAVPLHLAQAATYSVQIWFDLTRAPGGPTVWTKSWPLLVIATGAGWVLAKRLAETPGGEPEVAERPRFAKGRWQWMAWAAPAVFGVGVPLVMCALTVRGFKQVMMFWTLSGDAAVQSAWLAAGVGLSMATIALCVFLMLSSGDARAGVVAKWCTAAWLAAGLMPGVLVGNAFLALGLRYEWLGDSQGIVVMAHVARFGGAAACLGCLAARAAAVVTPLRRMDGALSLLGWMETALPLGGAAVLWAGLLGAMESLHEIESTIIVQPPGTPGLAQVMLGYLHYSRMEELSVGVLWIALGVSVLAGFGALGVRWLGFGPADPAAANQESD